MTRRGKDPKPKKGRGNIDKSESFSHARPSVVGRNSKKTQTHHASTIHLDSGDNSSGISQPSEENEETIWTKKINLNHIQPSQFMGSGMFKGEGMVDNEYVHAEEMVENQPKEEQSTFGFSIVGPHAVVQMKNIPPSLLPHFHGKVHEDPDSILFKLIYCVGVMITLRMLIS